MANFIPVMKYLMKFLILLISYSGLSAEPPKSQKEIDLMPLNDYATAPISLDFEEMINNQEISSFIDEAHERARNKLFKPLRAACIWPRFSIEIEAKPKFTLPPEQYFFYSSKIREVWTPITGDYRKEQIWAVSTN